MDTLPDIGRQPDYGLAGQPAFAVDTVSFGDGYEQRRPSGLNSVRRSWRVEWTLLDYTQMDALRDFLLSKKGVEAFLWEVEGESVQVVCKQAPQDSHTNFSTYSLSATFTEDFTP